jgi:prevent-host-death family protein
MKSYEMSLSALRPELFRLVPKLEESSEAIILTHNGKPVAVLMPYSEAPPNALIQEKP